MEIKTYYTNFTFEEELARGGWNFTYDKKNFFFEFLFLWLEDSEKVLWTKSVYSESFLNHIKEYRNDIPSLTQQSSNVEPWWGDSRNLDEKEINSKETSFHVRDFLGINLRSSYIAKKREDILVSTQANLYKSSLGFSGRGICREITALKSDLFPYIVEPRLNVLKNFGITFLENSTVFLIENLNDDKGQFKGGILCKTIPDHILINGLKIFDRYKELFDIKKIQIDLFSYLDDANDEKWNYLCEVNHRKTMGWILWQLHKKFGEEHSAIRICKKIPKVGIKAVKVITLAPEDHPMQMIFITSKDESAFSHYLSNLV